VAQSRKHDHEDDQTKTHGQEAGKPSALRGSPAFRGIPSGTGLGKYRILERIGTTFNAIIYKARDGMLDRSVTIKQMDPRLVDDPIACGEFKREAQLLARIPKDVPGLVHIHELIEAEEGLFIVQEYVDGDRLETLISKRQADATDAVRLLQTACRGLEALHSRRIVHRDICPENLLVTRDGMVRITNLACAAHEGDSTPPPAITPKYAAPEIQAAGEHDARADIYGLGFLIYELSVGRVVFRAHFADPMSELPHDDDFWRQWHCDLAAALPDATTLNPTVPPALSSILRKMTAKDLDHRLSSGREVLEMLSTQFSMVNKTDAPPALSAAAPTRVLEIRSQLRNPTPALPSSLGARGTTLLPDGLTWLVRHDQSTSRHVVRTFRDPDALLPLEQPPTKTAPMEPSLRAQPGRRIRRPSRRTLPPAPPRPVVPRNVPPLGKVEEPLRRRRRRLALPIALSAIILSALSLSVPYLWNHVNDNPQKRAIRQIIDDGIASYERGDYPAAFKQFEKATGLCAGKAGLGAEASESDLMLLLVEAQLALAKDDFDNAKQLLERAEVRGANPALLSALRTKYWNKKDVYRLAEDVNKDIEQHLFSSAKLKLGDYEEKARAAGLDPSSTKDKLELTRIDVKYRKALELAREKLSKKEFEGAGIACSDAEAIKITSATRQLRKQILDAQRREDWIIRGQRALADADFAAAEKAFTSANEIEPSIEIEQKVRTARAARLIDEARQAIKTGDLLLAERNLKRSRWELEGSPWKLPNPEAARMLERMRTAFEAARLAENADRAAADGDYEKAIHLYEKSLPKLPPPADNIVRAKLDKARRATTQPQK